NITIINQTSYDLTGFDLKLMNNVQYSPPDTADFHPDNYAHFHDVTSTTFSTFPTILTYTPDGAPAGPPGSIQPTPSEIKALDGFVGPGQSVTGSPIVLHSEENALLLNDFNAFSLAISATFDARPVIHTQNRIVQGYQSIAASSLITSVSDPYGYPITY